MDERIRANVTRNRHVNMFAELSRGHRVLLENYLRQEDGHHYEAMSCIVFAAFKHEAFLNHIGPRLFTRWEEVERKNHWKKLRMIANEIDVVLDFNRRPYRTITDLYEARNQLAHGRPQQLEIEQVETGTREELRRMVPQTEWETLCTTEFAQRAFEDTEAIATSLWESAGFENRSLRDDKRYYSIGETK